jgi:NAD(P)-dependent dehydrogenase (short-subunit alcohol dehydrogenase family)
MTKRTAVIVGVGARRGLGAALARRFAREEGLQVIIAGRTAERLEAIATEIRSAGGTAVPVVADVTEEQDVLDLFRVATADDGAVEVVVYNVGNNVMLPTLDTSPTVFEDLWRQNALGGFMVGQEAVRTMLPRQQGTLIFTGATASLRARPPFTAFASAKAALRAVAQGLAREFGPRGLHVAHVVIDGVIAGDYAQGRFPEYVRAKGEDGLIEPEAIAECYWALHAQPKCAWTHELDLRPFKEPF